MKPDTIMIPEIIYQVMSDVFRPRAETRFAWYPKPKKVRKATKDRSTVKAARKQRSKK